MSNSLYAVPAGLNADAYKSGHIKQYPSNTDTLFLNMTPRNDKYFPSPLSKNGVVAAGIQRFVQDYLVDHWNASFFNRPKEEAVTEILDIMNGVLGDKAISEDHWNKLHDLGYLPVRVFAVPEGVLVPMKVPMITFMNTVKGFHWVAGFLEDAFSAEIWKVCTIATIAMHYKRLGLKYAADTCDNDFHLDWQFHDFAMRGMSGLTDDAFNAIGHLFSFKGTDSFPAVYTTKRIYGGDMIGVSGIGGSVPATEHSVMCANIANHIRMNLASGDKEFQGLDLDDQRINGEIQTFEQLINTYPSGILSVVGDTYNFWALLDTILPHLREKILARDGKLVIRPDSGDPVKVVTGYKCIEITDLQDMNLVPPKSSLTIDDLKNYPEVVKFLKDEGYEMVVDQEDLEYILAVDLYSKDLVPVWKTVVEMQGAIESLYNTFGGKVNSKGYKELDSHIGLIYGDSITIERAQQIFKRLKAKGFASNNVVFGVGSFTYQYLTRDCFAFAVKATLAVIDGEEIHLSKDPITDDGTKKSAKGAVMAVWSPESGYASLGVVDGLTLEQFEGMLDHPECAMHEVFSNSVMTSKTTLDAIRGRINRAINHYEDKDI